MEKRILSGERLMQRFLITLCLTLAVLIGMHSSAQAQYVVYRPVVVAPAPVVSYYPAPVYYPPVVQTTYYQPSVSWYAPNVAYSAPVATTVYSAPVVATTVVAAPGYVTSRSYLGYGVFRPRGVYTSYYYNPAVSYYGGYVLP